MNEFRKKKLFDFIHFVKCEFLLNAIAMDLQKLFSIVLFTRSFVLTVHSEQCTYIIMQYFNQLIFAQLFRRIQISELCVFRSLLHISFIWQMVFGSESAIYIFYSMIIAWDALTQFHCYGFFFFSIGFDGFNQIVYNRVK